MGAFHPFGNESFVITLNHKITRGLVVTENYCNCLVIGEFPNFSLNVVAILNTWCERVSVVKIRNT